METQREDVCKVFIPSCVSDGEYVDRVVFEPSFFDEDGKLAPSAFSLRANSKKSEDYISVVRDKYCIIDEILACFPDRNNGDKAAGFAILLTGEIRAVSSPNQSDKLELDVVHKPTKMNPAHAGIFMMCNSTLISGANGHAMPLYSYIRKELVGLSKVVIVSKKSHQEP